MAKVEHALGVGGKYTLVGGVKKWIPVDGWVFRCPACDFQHSFEDGRWEFNGDVDKPTFTPSLLVKYGKDFHNVCHSYVRNGRIEFQNDCTHNMAGKTVELEDIV